jgi:hypothetical protein
MQEVRFGDTCAHCADVPEALLRLAVFAVTAWRSESGDRFRIRCATPRAAACGQKFIALSSD